MTRSASASSTSRMVSVPVGGGSGGVEGRVGGLEGQLPTPGHRVAGVPGQVHDDLLALPRVRLHLPEVRGEARLDLDVLADQPAEHLVDAGQYLVQVEDLRLQDLL